MAPSCSFTLFRAPLFAVLLCVAAMLLTSCGRRYCVEGDCAVSVWDGQTFYLRCLGADGEWFSVDSAEVEHGAFRMSGRYDSVSLVVLSSGGEGIIPLVLERGRVRVTLGMLDIAMRGTPLNDALYDFLVRRDALADTMEALGRREERLLMEGKSFEEVHAALAGDRLALSAEINRFVGDFIRAHYHDVLGPGAFMMVCSTLPYPVLTPEIEAIVDSAPAVFLENAYVRDYLSRAEDNMRVIEGRQSPSGDMGWPFPDPSY